jgi:hypothetical protein
VIGDTTGKEENMEIEGRGGDWQELDPEADLACAG